LSNQGEVADQMVMHFHLHVIPKYGKNEGFVGKIGTKIISDLDEVLNKIKKVI
jgi:histidine triad (HIT) family protein